MSSKPHIADESRWDEEAQRKYNPVFKPSLLEWWDSLNAQQKIWYCEAHPSSCLTKGHLGKEIFEGWDAPKMKVYHQKQAADLKLSLMGAVDLQTIAKLDQLYRLQLRLAGQNS
jgi:hypothetical protein